MRDRSVGYPVPLSSPIRTHQPMNKRHAKTARHCKIPLCGRALGALPQRSRGANAQRLAFSSVPVQFFEPHRHFHSFFRRAVCGTSSVMP